MSFDPKTATELLDATHATLKMIDEKLAAGGPGATVDCVRLLTALVGQLALYVLRAP